MVRAIKSEERRVYFQRANSKIDTWLLNKYIESKRQCNNNFKWQKVNL